MPETFSTSIDLFLKSKKVSVRPRTYEQYQYLVHQIVKGASILSLDQIILQEVSLNHLQSLVAILDDPAVFPGVGETTVKKMVKFIKASFTWFCRRTWIASNPALDLQFRRVHAKETQPFQTDELLALLSVQPTSSAGYRDLSMWFLFADTGLRCQELCQLRREDLSGNELVIRNGKGGKRRSVSLGSATMKLIQVYLDSYRPLGEVYIFLTDEGREMKPRHVAKRLELWAKKANVKNATPHRFRATFATQFVLKEGNDLIKLQALLGHTTLDMSRRYVKLAMEEEARLTNSACSVVDQLIAREQAEPAIRKDSPDGSNPPTPLSHMSPMGFQLNSPEAAMWMSMFQIVAGMMNAMFQAQSPGIQVPAAPVGISGGPFALPNAKLHEG